MPDSFKNSYKVKEREMTSLAVYNVGFQQCEPLYQWGPGIRDHYLIHYVVSGHGFYQVGDTANFDGTANFVGGAYTLNPGDTFLIYPQTKVTYFADANLPWEYYWVGFWGSEASSLLGATDFSPESPVIYGGSFSDSIKNLILKIYEARGNDFVHATEMTGLLYIALAQFIKASANRPIIKEASYTYVQKAIDYINYHYAYPVSVDEIAHYIGISRSQLFRVFKAHLSKSPKEYLTEFRIRQACTLLKQPNLSIAVIAASVGFDNSLYFSKVFNKIKGMSPTAYRGHSES